LAIVAPVWANSAYSPDPSTIQLWHFDESNGSSTRQLVGTATSGQLLGGIERTSGKFGSAIQFNGTDAKLHVTGAPRTEIGPAQALTIEAWVKVFKHGKTQPILSAPPLVELEIRRENGAVSFNLQTITGKTSIRCTGKRDVTDGKWHHIAGVRDPQKKTVSVYIDGRLDTEVPDITLGQKLLIPDQFYIGGNQSGSEMLGGVIDELRISSAVRKFAAISSEAPDIKAEHQVLENNRIRLTFNTVGSSVYLSSLFDKTENVEFIAPVRAENIWDATMRSRTSTTVLDEQQAKLAVQRKKTEGSQEIDFIWKGLPAGQMQNQVDVVVTVNLPNDSSMSDWRINIDNHSKEYGLWMARFPRISNLARLASDGTDCLAIPGGNGGGAGEGQIYKDPIKILTHPFIRTYPCYQQSMQFNTYYNDHAGLYLAALDGKMNLKGFLFQPQSGETPTMLYEMYQYPANAGVPGTGLKQAYPHVIGTYQGNWYDACQMYRKWALKQVWCQLGPLEKRTDITPWIRNGAYWMVGTFEWEPTNQPPMRKLARTLPIEQARKRVRKIDVDKSLAMVREAREFFGFPLLLWTNEWWDGGGDISPPRYMPMGNLKEYMDRLHTEYPDVHVSGHMQMKRYSVQLAEYNQQVEKSLEWTPEGKPAIEPLGAMDKGDQIAYPCWATDFWYNFWNKKAKEIVSETDLDGFHCDELASATSFEAQCFNPNHGHPIGGGTLYSDTRRRNIKMLRDSARTVKPHFAIHHEALCEIYVDRDDLQEVCTAPSNNNIPMFEAVYHDYSFVMGRRIHPWMDRRTFPIGDPKYGDNDINQFVSSFAQAFIWGNQPGWTRLDIVQYSPKVAEYIKRSMHVRYHNMKYLNVGRMIRSLTVTKKLPTVTNIWTTCETPEVTLPVILNSVWRASDGTIGIVLANITDQPQTIKYAYDLSENGGQHAKWKLQRTDGNSPREMGIVNGGQLQRSDEVPPRSMIVIEAAPQQ
jgi:hypothetical protein